jgi:hypothetical protein
MPPTEKADTVGEVIELRVEMRFLRQEVARLAQAVEKSNGDHEARIRALEANEERRRGERAIIGTISGALGALVTLLISWLLNRHGG